MRSQSSVATLRLTPMTRVEAGALVDRMLGSYPSLGLHDPETYISVICSLLCGYPLWAAERAIELATIEAKFAPPTPGVLKPLLESEVRTARYAAEWDSGARDQLLQLAGPPRAPRPTMEQLRAKYGPNWGIGAGLKKPQTREEARTALAAEIGREAFDAIPEAGDEGWRTIAEAADRAAKKVTA